MIRIRMLVLDCPVFDGNSDGPVIEIEEDVFKNRCKVIGVTTQWIPTLAKGINNDSPGTLVNSGYSIATSLDGVMNLVKELKHTILGKNQFKAWLSQTKI